MISYTLAMFQADQDAIEEKLELLKDIEFSESLAPKVYIEDIGEVGLNLNHPYARVLNLTMQHFRHKYSDAHGDDVAWDWGMRFLAVSNLIARHKKRLIREGILNDKGVASSFLDVLLESFSPPTPPCIHPQSSLSSKSTDVSVTKAVKAWKEKLKPNRNQ